MAVQPFQGAVPEPQATVMTTMAAALPEVQATTAAAIHQAEAQAVIAAEDTVVDQAEVQEDTAEEEHPEAAEAQVREDRPTFT